jgi:hypothetical protein
MITIISNGITIRLFFWDYPRIPTKIYGPKNYDGITMDYI